MGKKIKNFTEIMSFKLSLKNRKFIEKKAENHDNNISKALREILKEYSQGRSLKIGKYTIDTKMDKNKINVSLWNTEDLTMGGMPQYIGEYTFNLSKE